MGDPRDTNGTGQRMLYGYVSKTEARPDSPAWEGGRGQFASPLQYGRSGGLLLHRQTSPAAVTSDRQPGYSPSELWDGATCIAEARFLAEFTYAPGAIMEETGRTLDEILEGLLPGLVLTGCAIGICTLLGGVVGGIVGSLAFGAGAVPGAAVGAEIGFDVGLALVTWLGIGFLVVHIAESLGDVTKAMVEGVELAWNARGRPGPARSKHIHLGAKRMAQGIAIFFRLVLEGVVMYLLEKGAPAVAARLSELVARLKASPRGEALAVWVTKNYKSLLEDPKVNPNLRPRKGGHADGAPAPPQPQPAARQQTQAAKTETAKGKATTPTKGQPASFGNSTSTNYKKTFFDAHPETKGEVVVHHAVEQQALDRYPGLVSESEMHSLQNLRGIPKSINNDVHLSQIRKSWNQFYRANPSPTKQQLLDHATKVDNQFGHLFNPPVR